MLDHLFLTVGDVPAAIAFYEHALAPLGIRHVHDYNGADGPPGHPDLKGFGSNGRIYFWPRAGTTIRATTRPISSTWMATASKSSTKAGSTRGSPAGMLMYGQEGIIPSPRRPQCPYPAMSMAPTTRR